MNAMNAAPAPITTIEQFTTTMLESARLHTDDRWAVARTRSGEQPTWLAGFDGNRPMWVPKIEDAAIYDRGGVEGAILGCTGLPDLDDTLYAACHLKGENTFMGVR